MSRASLQSVSGASRFGIADIASPSRNGSSQTVLAANFAVALMDEKGKAKHESADHALMLDAENISTHLTSYPRPRRMARPQKSLTTR